MRNQELKNAVRKTRNEQVAKDFHESQIFQNSGNTKMNIFLILRHVSDISLKCLEDGV